MSIRYSRSFAAIALVASACVGSLAGAHAESLVVDSLPSTAAGAASAGTAGHLDAGRSLDLELHASPQVMRIAGLDDELASAGASHASEGSTHEHGVHLEQPTTGRLSLGYLPAHSDETPGGKPAIDPPVYGLKLSF